MMVGSLFEPASEAISHPEMVRSALAVVEAFTDRFNARDLAGMDDNLHFPHVILSGEQLVVWDRPGQLPQDFFEGLIRGGWDRTAYSGKRAVLVGPRKVHLVVAYTRNRQDGSVISGHESLWIVTLESERWAIKQRSY